MPNPGRWKPVHPADRQHAAVFIGWFLLLLATHFCITHHTQP